MNPNSYDYQQRQGVWPISWNDFHALCKGLALAAAPFQPQLILATGRGGYYPGTLLAHMMRVELFPLRLTRREADVVVRREPEWLIRPPAELVDGRRILVVDEISSSGQTLQMVKAAALELGAAEVRCAVMYAHTPGVTVPDYIGIISDALLLNPWDRELLQNGQFVWHPEYAQAMAQQGLAAEDHWLIGVEPLPLAKAHPNSE